jgi:hypothetical protein
MLILFLVWAVGGVLGVILDIKVAYKWDWAAPFRTYKVGGLIDYLVPFVLSWAGIAFYAFDKD